MDFGIVLQTDPPARDVVEGLRAKLVDYESQLQKVRAALNGLSS